jgi:hypothetical protein
MKGVRVVGPERKRSSLLLLLLLLTVVALVSWQLGWSVIGVQAFGPLHASTRSLRPRIRVLSQQPTVRSLSNNDNNNNNNENNDGKENENENNGSDGPLDFELLSRRFNKADKTEIRNDATLVACYVLCRFLVYDITSGAKIEPGWEVQDWIWLTGTFSSATVLVVYYVTAGLLSRTYEANTSFAAFGPPPVLRTLINVALCCPVWLATEHLLGFGPANIGGDTLAVSVATGFVGLGSFMALAKILTAGIR